MKIILKNENGIEIKEFLAMKENISYGVYNDSIYFKNKNILISLNDREINKRNEEFYQI